MMKILDRIKILHLLTIAVILCGVLSLIVYWFPVVRLVESCRDMGTSMSYYVQKIIFHKETTATITEPSSLDFFVLFPISWEEFKEAMSDYLPTFFSMDNFGGYLVIVFKILYEISFAFLLFLPVLIGLFIIFRMSFTTKQGEEKISVPLKLYLHFQKIIKDKAKDVFHQLKVHFQKNRIYIYIFIGVAALYFNVATIAIELVAYYFFFVAAFDFASLFTMLYKIVFDIAIMLFSSSWLFWVIVGAVALHFIREYFGKKKLRHNEAKNKGFINALPILNYCTSTTGAGKTLFGTDMALSNECIFHHDALNDLFQADLKFPKYPWYQFESAFTKAIEEHKVYNLATARDWVKATAGQEYKDGRDYFGYDIIENPIVYHNGLYEESLISVLTVYAQLFYVYITECMIIANYSIRTDCYKDKGHFPLWKEDFFTFKEKKSRFCHILDFDILRLGQKVMQNNPKSGSLEFGVLLISEIDKERGNKFDLEQIDVNSDEANQKNDLTNLDLRMRRHAATINNKCYFRMFSEAQRDSDLGAGIREICYLTHIASKDETELAMPFFLVEELINQSLRSVLKKDYYDFRNNRVDQTLTMYLYKRIVGRFLNHYDRTYMKYGYHRLTIQKERGDGIGEPEEAYYYIQYGKIYNNRYSTDCFADFYAEQARNAKVGLNDYECYQGVRASMDELESQHSYFIKRVSDLKNENTEGKNHEKKNRSKSASNDDVPDWVISQQRAQAKTKRTK